MHGDCSIRISGLGFTDDEIAACAARGGLLAIELDLASGNVCGCEACQQSPSPPLTLAEIAGLLRQAAAEGARRCVLANGDEAVHPQLRAIIDAAAELHMGVELLAGGGVIDSPLAGFLSERNVAVVVEYGESYDVALNHLKHAAGPPTAIAITADSTNREEISTLWRNARRDGVEPYLQIIKPGKSALQPGQIRSLMEELARIDSAEFGRAWPTPPALTGRSCKRHQFACHVTPCGTIFACVGVTIPLGNIRTESLHEIVELSEVLENLRDFHRKVKEPCGTCCQSVDCYGCRGAAYQLTGDYLAGDAICWKAEGIDIERLPADVAGLIPHGKKVRMADRLVQVGERIARTEFDVSSQCELLDPAGRLDEVAFIEMIAQSFAASHGYHLSLAERAVHRGLLLGAKDLVVHGEARLGDRLTVTVRKITRFGPFGVVEGEIRNQEGKLLAAGQVKVWRQEGENPA